MSLANRAPHLLSSMGGRVAIDATLTAPGLATIEIRCGEDIVTFPVNRTDLRCLQLWLGLLENDVQGGSDGELAYQYAGPVALPIRIGGG